MFRKKPQYVANPYVAPTRAAASAAPSLDSTISDANMRTDNLEGRISQLEQQIATYKRDMSKHRPGTAAHSTAKRRALQALRQKKSLEGRIQSASNVQFNLEQVRDAQLSQRDNIATVQGMKAATQDLRKANQAFDLDEVEDAQDEMQEVLEDVAQVNDVLGRQYDVDNVDTSELEAELDELEDDAVNFVSQGAGYAVQGEAPAVMPTQHQQHAAPPPQQQHAQYQSQTQYQSHPAYANPQGGRY